MPKLPVLSGRKLMKFLEQEGFYLRRQAGSHIIMRQDDPFRQTVVPDHKVLDRGTLRAILKQSGIEPEYFVEHWK